MSGHTMDDIRKHVKIYIAVFFALAILTVVTVWVASLDFSPTMHIVVALTIAVIKGTLVAAFFMHLISEKKSIGSILILTAFLFLFMLLVPFFVDHTRSPIGTQYFNVPTKLPAASESAHHE